MDIESGLREILVLENPGKRFTDGVMSRVGNASVGLPRDGVVRLADARLRKRSRRILLGTLVVVGAAASMLPWALRAPVDARAVQATTVLAAESSAADSSAQVPVQSQARSEPSTDADDPLACVDPDVLRGLLLQLPNQSYRMGAPNPPELSEFKAPRQLVWMGTTERTLGTTQVSVVYRTGLSPDAASNVTVRTLAAGGWELRSDAAFNTTNVFKAVSYRSGETYCREGKPVDVNASALDGVTYVVLTVSRNSGGTGDFNNVCDQPAPRMASPVSALDKYMPKLELPRDPATGQPVAMQGGGGGGGDPKRRMNVSFMVKDTADNVARHFARQMAEQGWNADTNWSGTGTAGSSWTRPGDVDTLLQGTLMVSAFDEGWFTVVFQVVTTK